MWKVELKIAGVGAKQLMVALKSDVIVHPCRPRDGAGHSKIIGGQAR